MDVAGIHSALNQKSHKILFFVYLFCIHFAGFAYILLVLHICNILFHLYGGHIGVDHQRVDAFLLQRLDRLNKNCNLKIWNFSWEQILAQS